MNSIEEQEREDIQIKKAKGQIKLKTCPCCKKEFKFPTRKELDEMKECNSCRIKAGKEPINWSV